MPLTERVKWWRQADYLFGAGLTISQPLLLRVSFWPSVPPAPPRVSSKGSARLPSVFMRDRIDHRAPPESRALAAAPGCHGCTRCVGQRGQRVLYGDDGQPGALQALDHRRPGRAVGAVNQHGAGFGSQRARSCPSSFVRHGSQCSRLGRTQVPALGPRAPVASVAFSVLLKGAGQGGEDVTCMVAGHQVAAGPEVWSSVPGTGEGWRPPAGRP